MTDEDPDSFAARAAAWIPPWQRDAAAEPATGPEPADEPSSEPEAVTEPAPVVAGDEPGPVAASEEPETEAAPVAAAELESEAAPVAAGEEPGPVVVSEEPEPEAEPVVAVEPEPEPVTAIEPEPVPAEPLPEPVAVAELPEPVPVPEESAETGDGPGAPADLSAALEAILMVVDEPVTEQLLAQVLEQPTERVGTELTRLAQQYGEQRRGFELRRAAGGWRFYTHPDQAAYVERFVLDGQSIRLTQAALETLAVVAYKQPVTRSRMSAIRGVNCDGVVRTLVTRGLIEECGTEPESGAHLYKTTTLFLEKLGLDTVEQLPPLAPFLPDDMDAIADAGR
jgi:segregation and condensation protein B